MVKDEWRQGLFWLGVAILATVALAGGLSRLQLQPGQPFPFWFLLQGGEAGSSYGLGGTSTIDFLWRFLVSLLVFVIMPLWLIIFVFSPHARRDMLQKLPIYLVWMLLIYALVRTLRKAEPVPNMLGEGGAGGSSLEAHPGTLPAPPAFIVDPPQWLVLGLSLVLIGLVLAAAWFIWQRSRRQPDNPLLALVSEAQQAVETLQAGGNLADTVRRCYLEMSRVLSRQRGLQRSRAMTPREFEQYLAEAGLGDEHIHRLTRLFERVRYGGQPAGADEQREAVTCLTAIIQAYGRPS